MTEKLLNLGSPMLRGRAELTPDKSSLAGPKSESSQAGGSTPWAEERESRSVAKRSVLLMV